MTEINKISANDGVSPVRPNRPPATAEAQPTSQKAEDQVEISEVAQLLVKLSELPEVHEDKVQELREAIARGDYETPDKIEVAVDRILEELALEDQLR